MIAVVNGLGPPLTILMAFIFLKEKVKLFEIIMMALSIGTILMFTLTAEGSIAGDNDYSKVVMGVNFGLLALLPILSSVGTLSMRKMKKFNE